MSHPVISREQHEALRHYSFGELNAYLYKIYAGGWADCYEAAVDRTESVSVPKTIRKKIRKALKINE